MSKCIINVRFKPYVAQFIRSVELINPDEPVNLSDGGLLATLVKTFLCGKTFYIHKRRPNSEHRKQHTETIGFVPDAAQWDRGRLFLTAKHELELSQLCRKFMLVVLVSHIDRCVRSGKGTVLSSTREFIRDYQLDDLVDEDALLRAANRLRKSKGLEPYGRSQNNNAAISRQKRDRDS